MESRMIFDPAEISKLLKPPFDEVIDVRSPSEFLDDHIPNAINLPVLDDEERHSVGTVYTRESRFKAKRMGAAMLARNAARHLETALCTKGPSYRPLIYCWRGGQRSAAFAEILSQIGFRATTLAGGYRTYRRLVREFLYTHPFPVEIVLLDGNTGTAKTEILCRLENHGVQTIDLEYLANHRGSLFGSLSGGQPTQKSFEGRIVSRFAAFDHRLPVVVEAESSRIGNRQIPPSLWKRMASAGRIEILAPLRERARYIVGSYGELTGDRSALKARIKALQPFHPRETVVGWLQLAENGASEQLALELMEAHYDPRYRKHRARGRFDVLAALNLNNLDGDGLDSAAREISDLLLSQ